MKKSSLFSWILFLTMFFSGLSFFYLANTVNAITSDPLAGLEDSAGEVEAYEGQSVDNNFIQTKVGQIISILLSFVGVLFFILMIYAGILWMTAQGNEQQVSKAKNLLINATIGLIITLAAYAITSFIGTEILK
mgnify:FL=1